MALVVPANSKHYSKYLETTAIATALTTATGAAVDSMRQKQLQLNTELVHSLIATGNLSPLTILAAATFGT
jgi:hypothetical protein